MLPAAPRERLTLPTVPAPSQRAAFPLVATLAPVLVSLALWMLTQSIYSLLFAVLGPVVAIGGLWDGRVNRRRTARRERVRFLAALGATAESVASAHERERVRLSRLSPDPAATIGWAATTRTETQGHPIPVRVGSGTIGGRIELAGDDPDSDAVGPASELRAATLAIRSAAGELCDAPIVVDAREGIGIVGPPVVASAVARQLALRLAARFSPVDARLSAPEGESWTRDLPHAVTAGTAHTYSWLEGDTAPVVISWAQNDDDLPLGCGIRLATGADDGVSGDRVGEDARDVAPDAASIAEASAVVVGWRDRAGALGLRPPGAELPALVRLADVLGHAPHPDQGRKVLSLAAPIGKDAKGTVVLDLISQGPHAVIAGTTGSGKSELLVSWILGMASGRSPDELSFLLVDFKGGSAFAPLEVLPHVMATLSDLDARLTRRAIESLRAELLHRERVLAAASARSITELPVGALPRLVIVVDEYAAVVSASPELHEVFGDLAARGRSLGLHLILCTQRPAGVIRDAVLANVTLRISLRVTDRGDSVAMIGNDAASRLPAEPRGRGILATDAEPRMLQVAIAEPSDAASITQASPAATVRRPWCAPLPTQISLDAIPATEQGFAFGLLDLPAEQRQPTGAWDPDRDGHLLALGASGSGSTTALQTLVVSAARSGARVRVIPSAPEEAWQVLSQVGERASGEGGDVSSDRRTLFVIDDLDALVARYDADYRHEFLELLSTVAREGSATRTTVAASARRLSGSLAGIAGSFGSRLLLRQTSRDEHVLAGGDPREFDPDLPPGAGTWRGRTIQVARAEDSELRTAWRVASAVPTPIVPADFPVLALVAGRPRALGEQMRARGARVIDLGDGAAHSASELHISTGAVPTVLLGDPDAWLAQWELLSVARRDWPIVLVDATPADVRALLRQRTLPPPLGTHPGECWYSAQGQTERAALVLS